MVIFPLAPDQTTAQMWSNGAWGGWEWRCQGWERWRWRGRNGWRVEGGNKDPTTMEGAKASVPRGQQRGRCPTRGRSPPQCWNHGQEYLFAPAIICEVYQLVASQNFSIHLKFLCVVHLYIVQESPAVANKPVRRESMPKIAPIRRAKNVVADNTGLSSFG